MKSFNAETTNNYFRNIFFPKDKNYIRITRDRSTNSSNEQILIGMKNVKNLQT